MRGYGLCALHYLREENDCDRGIHVCVVTTRWSCVDDPNQKQARGSVTSADLKAQEFQGHEMGPTETILNITATSVV